MNWLDVDLEDVKNQPPRERMPYEDDDRDGDSPVDDASILGANDLEHQQRLSQSMRISRDLQRAASEECRLKRVLTADGLRAFSYRITAMRGSFESICEQRDIADEEELDSMILGGDAQFIEPCGDTLRSNESNEASAVSRRASEVGNTRVSLRPADSERLKIASLQCEFQGADMASRSNNDIDREPSSRLKRIMRPLAWPSKVDSELASPEEIDQQGAPGSRRDSGSVRNGKPSIIRLCSLHAAILAKHAKHKTDSSTCYSQGDDVPSRFHNSDFEPSSRHNSDCDFTHQEDAEQHHARTVEQPLHVNCAKPESPVDKRRYLRPHLLAAQKCAAAQDGQCSERCSSLPYEHQAE